MAKKLLFVDDLSTGAKVRTSRFSLDGDDYEIDLAEGSYAVLKSTLKPFLKKTEKTSRVTAEAPKRKRGRPRKSESPRPRVTQHNEAAYIRAWARSKKMDVPQRGRVPADLRDAWIEAGSPVI